MLKEILSKILQRDLVIKKYISATSMCFPQKSFASPSIIRFALGSTLFVVAYRNFLNLFNKTDH